MGEGRNALYLAKKGWMVTGFDIADKAIEIAGRRADQSGVKIDMVVADDKDWKYEDSGWDLMLRLARSVRTLL